MIYTFPSSASGMKEEFEEEARQRGSKTDLMTVFCDGALETKRAGDNNRHDQLIAETATRIDGADVIMLAQFSMASAAERARQQTATPILTSPEAAIEEIRRRVEAPRWKASSLREHEPANGKRDERRTDRPL